MRVRIRGNSVASTITNGISAQRSLSIETRLLIPCIINTVLFVVGQVSKLPSMKPPFTPGTNSFPRSLVSL